MVANGFPALTAGTDDESGTGNGNGTGVPRRIEAAYRDNPVVDVDEEDSASRSLVSANRSENTQNRSENYGPTVQPSRLHDESNEWTHA